GNDLFDFDQSVRTQGAAGRNEIDDRIGETGQRRELHRPIELDQIDVDALGSKEFARAGDVLGCHPQSRSTTHRVGVVEAIRYGDTQSTAPDAEIERLREPDLTPLRTMLEQDVLAGDASLRRAVLHVGWHVRGTYYDQPHAGFGRRNDELARPLGV